jgi:hypothetical protein
MKWILKRCLLAAPAIIFYSLFSFNVCLVTGCNSSDSTGPNNNPRKVTPLQLSVQSSTDSTGPKVILHTSGKIPAGSTLVLSCTSPDCNLSFSTDSTGGHGGVRIVNLGTITKDIPENTEFELKVIAKGDPAMVK